MKSLLELPADQLLDGFAASTTAPAAGSAAALTAAVAAALVEMVAKLTVEKADSGAERLRIRYGAYRERAAEIAAQADGLRAELQRLVQEDAEWVEALVQLRRSAEADTRPSIMARQGVELPLRTTRAALQVAEYAEELVAHGYRSAAGDAAVAVTLALAAGDAALAITAANLADERTDFEGVAEAGAEYDVLSTRLAGLRERLTDGRSASDQGPA